MSLPPGATLVSGSVPQPAMKLPPGATLVSGGPTAIDLSGGLVPKQAAPSVDISAGLVPKDNGLDTLVVDPDFAKLAPADQRRALAGVSGDNSFSQLDDAQTGRYIAGHRAALGTSQPIAPGTFQTKPGGSLLNVDTLGTQPLTPVPGTSPGTAAKARAALPQFPQQVKQSVGEEAQMLPEVGGILGTAMGPTGSALGAALGTLSKTFLTGEPADLNEAVENAAKAWVTQKAFELLPAAAQKTWHFFAGDTSEAAGWRAINQVLGVKPSQIKMPTGATDIGDAYNIPGRSIANETGLSASDFQKMNPFEQAEAIKPHWQAAGRNVSKIADAATQSGTTLDLDKSIQEGLAQIDDPIVRARAQQIINRVAQSSGLDPGLAWKSATPNQAVELRGALWDSLPSRWRGPIYGSVTGDLKNAVPDIVPADQTYSELRTGMDAIKSGSQRFAVTAPQSTAAVLAKKALPYAIGATGLAVPGLVYESMKALTAPK